MIKHSLFLLLSLGFTGTPVNLNLTTYNYTNSRESLGEVTQLLAVMVQFPEETDDDLLTSGNGTFLSSGSQEIDDRCDGFHADPPPHDRAYFSSQLLAIKNYYSHISGGNIDLNYHVINDIFTVSGDMRSYADSDSSLGRLFSETVELASDSLSIHFDENSLIILFHAGIGQDFTIPFLDPTPYDLKSAYVDDGIMADTPWPQINGVTVDRGIILPETQNHLYYEVIEDIFYGETDFCDYQVGLTGTFAFLMGYAFDLPPLFNTETGDPGVGVFGLMDQGSNNGRGVIPVPPDAWTRILKGWDESNLVSSYGPESISTNNYYGQFHEIHKIPISESEYYLVENRNNWVHSSKTIDEIRYENLNSDNRPAHWFGTVTSEMSEGQIDIDPDTGVITRFDHYDYGLPGSGLLIWHINEPEDSQLMNGINNDNYNRAVHLEEADGSVDIGFESYAVFQSDDPTSGRIWDMWYRGNGGYFFANDTLKIRPGDEPFGTRPWFTESSFPNTNSSSGGKTYISIDMISEAGSVMNYQYSKELPFETVLLSDEDILISGAAVSENNQSSSIFYIQDQQLFSYGLTLDSIFIADWQGYVLSSEECGGDTFHINIDLYDSLYIDPADCQLHDLSEVDPMGFIQNDDEIAPAPDAVALGDIDDDGLDEIIKIVSGNIHAINGNGTICNGFPVNGSFTGDVVIANIIDDVNVEIICRENDNIVILSNEGYRLFEIASVQPEALLLAVPHIETGKIAIVDGKRLLLFPHDPDRDYWLSPHGRFSNQPVVNGLHIQPNAPNYGIDKKRSYNYPNPIVDGETTFRYFVGSATAVSIKIYNSSGRLITELQDTDLTSNEYNETQWHPGTINPGLYLAEVKPNSGPSDLVQVVFLK